jgi:phospholipase/carboxylesterase
MAPSNWSTDQLGALADEWIAEREAFSVSLQVYLDTQLPRVQPDRQQQLARDVYQAELQAIGSRLHRFLRTMDDTVWYTLQSRLGDFQHQLETDYRAAAYHDLAWLATTRPPEHAIAVHEAVRQATGLLQHILYVYKELNGVFDFPTLRFTRRLVSQIKYRLYPVRLSLPDFQHYWLLDDADVTLYEPPIAQPDSGLHYHEVDQQRSAYTAYVPEYYTPDRAWPLILALHGGGGNDEDFLWTWLKYAKSRGYLLISAKSFGATWYPWDAPSILSMLDDMQARYHIDPLRILLTGLSDGGSFGYEVGFAFPERFSGLAVVAGILRPHQRTPQARHLPVYIAHGAQDQLFPIQYIRLVTDKLRELGHSVTYHELPNFGHTYPAGENTAILDWFETVTPTNQSVA